MSGFLPSLAAIFDYILREIWDPETEPFVMIVEDDFVGMLPMMRATKAMMTDPQDIIALFWETYWTAEEMGAHVFGFSPTVTPGFRDVSRPAALRRWVHQVYGVSDPELGFDHRLYRSDTVDLCLSAMARDRIVYTDLRWAHDCGPKNQPGGNSALLTQERYEADFEILREKWGYDLRRDSEAASYMGADGKRNLRGNRSQSYGVNFSVR